MNLLTHRFSPLPPEGSLSLSLSLSSTPIADLISAVL